MSSQRPGRLARIRASQPWLDHLIRAVSRYLADNGDSLAASVTFYGFLSFFPAIALAFAVAGYLAVIFPGVQDTINSALNGFLPGLVGTGHNQINVTKIADAKAGATVIGLVGLLIAGEGWVNALRQGIRTIWHQNLTEGNLITRRGIDAVVLVGLGATMLATVAVSGLANSATSDVIDALGVSGVSGMDAVVRVVGYLFSILTNTALFLYLFTRLPKAHGPWRRVLRPALLGAVGFWLLTLLGGFYISHTTSNPVYGIFAAVVGLLVWINLVTRLTLITAAWAVTGPYDSDVPPSGTSSREQAEAAGIPPGYAEHGPDDPPTMVGGGAPSPLREALNKRGAVQALGSFSRR